MYTTFGPDAFPISTLARGQWPALTAVWDVRFAPLGFVSNATPIIIWIHLPMPVFSMQRLMRQILVILAPISLTLTLLSTRLWHQVACPPIPQTRMTLIPLILKCCNITILYWWIWLISIISWSLKTLHSSAICPSSHPNIFHFSTFLSNSISTSSSDYWTKCQPPVKSLNHSSAFLSISMTFGSTITTNAHTATQPSKCSRESKTSKTKSGKPFLSKNC